MRKVTYKINDIEWFRRDMVSHHPEWTMDQINEILSAMNEPFIAEYSLYGNGNQPEKYELIVNGEPWSINDKRLNGYHKGCILNDCMRQFIGAERDKYNITPEYPKEEAFGCLEIIETEVGEE